MSDGRRDILVGDTQLCVRSGHSLPKPRAQRDEASQTGGEFGVRHIALQASYRDRVAFEDIGKRARLLWVSEGCASAMGLHEAELSLGQPRPLKHGLDQVGLRHAVWRGQAGTAAILPHADRAQHGMNRLVFFSRAECRSAGALASAVAICSLVKCVAAAPF